MKKLAQDLPEVTLSEEDGVRYLHLGTPWIQGGMRIKQPQVVEIDYVQRMLASLLWLPALSSGDAEDARAGRAVQLGLGAGALTRFTAVQLRMETTVVEINPQVIAVNGNWFHLPQQAEVVRGDAADWLAQAEPHSVRLLFVDLYDHEAAAPVLDSAEFYADCRALLSENGCMTVNLFGRASSFTRSVEQMTAAFGEDALWSFKPTREGNTVVLAQRTPSRFKRGELAARCADVQQRWGLPTAKWVRGFKPLAS